ncbi:fibroblast growth factor 2 isoform X2 [Oncorhynchus mykiss]|uniref:fibroblast growth factor 2 isoform X2 n=1 Tax=Oncorhynchus mykiss TaxID=8022 RepID=UPI000B4F7BE8|nr:fibroblast growth factor 2 isoform X2 [Oncorhynchus mykiss]
MLHLGPILTPPQTKRRSAVKNPVNGFKEELLWPLLVAPDAVGEFNPVQHPDSVKLQLQATSVGEVVIKGVSANRYLAMNGDGRLFGTRRTTDECYFMERLESNNYNTYRSRKYPDMYVALKRTGQHKSGSKTGPGQKAILFLPMSARR